MTTAVTAEEVTTEAGFDALREDWTALLGRLDLPSPFQTWEWHRSWWRHFAKPGDRLRMVVFRAGEELVGIVPFFERRHLGGLIELVPIGWRDQLTEQLDLLFAASLRTSLLVALWDWLERTSWTWTCLPQLREADELPEAALARLADATSIVFEHHLLPESWEALDRGLNKSMRDNVRYYPKLMLREGHPFSLEVARSASEVRAAMPILWDLHSARAAAPTSIRHLDYMAPANRRGFMEEVIPQLADGGQAAIGVLRVRGEAVAAQMWLQQGGVIFLYYSGYLPAWSKYSVAMITTSEIFKDTMARGVRRVEFLRGANQFKSRWGTQKRTESELVLARRPTLVRARFFYRRQVREQRARVERRLRILRESIARRRPGA
jgi:CelD/BcsL family acetyltransferase involved in cellulose biosynthesis